MQASETKAGARLDKWLWAARFFKTRSLAAEEIARGRVLANGQVAKASREVRTGDTISLRQGTVARTVVVLGVSAARGPATVAQALYRTYGFEVAGRRSRYYTDDGEDALVMTTPPLADPAMRRTIETQRARLDR